MVTTRRSRGRGVKQENEGLWFLVNCNDNVVRQHSLAQSTMKHHSGTQCTDNAAPYTVMTVMTTVDMSVVSLYDDTPALPAIQSNATQQTTNCSSLEEHDEIPLMAVLC